MSVTNYLANGDRAVEALTLSDIEVDLDVPALGARNVEAAELLLADRRAVAAFSVVVGVDVRSSIGRGEAGGNIDPAQVVVNAEGDDEVLVAAPEAEDAGRTAAAHGEDLLVVEFSPGATVGVVPDCLFDDLEPGVGVGLVDAASDSVRHGSFCERSEFGGRTAIEGLLTWLGLECLRVRLGACMVESCPRSSLLYSLQIKLSPPRVQNRCPCFFLQVSTSRCLQRRKIVVVTPRCPCVCIGGYWGATSIGFMSGMCKAEASNLEVQGRTQT
jgi:hypothetical protein